MIDLYYWTTPNGHKITMFLEEAGLPYRIIPINPNEAEVEGLDANVPVVSGLPNGTPLALFESGAILLYLAEKTGKFIPADLAGRAEVLQWLFWQMGGLGPMAGQNHHFAHYAKDKIPYAIDRYVQETNRLYGVLNKRLADRPFVAGKDYSIADMASYPWTVSHERQGQNLNDFPHMKRWFEVIRARPATVAAYARVQEVNPQAGKPMTEDEKKILFGQTAAVVR